MKKTYVLDTNVLVYDPTAIYKFEDNDIILPITIIKEIDSFKGEMTERGRNAREIARILSSLDGSLMTGITLPQGGKLSVKIDSDANDRSSFDDQILGTAAFVKRKKNPSPVILVSMDINLRLLAESHGIAAEDYKNQSTNTKKIKNNIKTIEVDFDTTNLFKGNGIEVDFDMLKNECFMLQLQDGKTILAREKKGLLKGIAGHKNVMSISPRNIGQTFALEFLMDDDINLVCISGSSGSGKTILSSAVGLQKTIEEGLYTKMLISRPIVPMGKDIGYLPGSINEKLLPYMKPIFDNMDLILMSRGKRNTPLDKLIEEGTVEIEPLTYIRGRSLPSQFMIIDECQNATPHEAKTIITRCGENTKLVLTGDITQIDSPYMTEATNGLSYVMNKMQDNDIVANIHLEVGERSPLANLGVEKL
jgi:PhoH-like ATPase